MSKTLRAAQPRAALFVYRRLPPGGCDADKILAAGQVDEHTERGDREHKDETGIKDIVLVDPHKSF